MCKYKVVAPSDAIVDSSLLVGNADICENTAPETNKINITGMYGKGEYSVTVDATIGTNEIESFQFCIRTEVKNAELQVMTFHQQLLQSEFDLSGNFLVNNINSSNFSNEEGKDFGLKNYPLRAFRVDADGNTTSSALQSGIILYIKIESTTIGVLIDTVSKFEAKKNDKIDLTVENNPSNFFIVGQSTQTVTVACRLPVSFFEASTSITLVGSVQFEIQGRRYLGRVTQAVPKTNEGGSADFQMQVDFVSLDKSSSADKATSAFGSLGLVAALVLA